MGPVEYLDFLCYYFPSFNSSLLKNQKECSSSVYDFASPIGAICSGSIDDNKTDEVSRFASSGNLSVSFNVPNLMAK